MTIKEEDINELDQHRQGELSEAEIKTLSDRLREDADFQRTPNYTKQSWMVFGIKEGKSFKSDWINFIQKRNKEIRCSNS